MRTTLSAIAICAVFLAGNESIRFAHNRMMSAWLPDIYGESWELTYQDPCRIAFLGDSIFLTGLDPSIIPDSYNFSWLGTSYLENSFMLNWMLRANPAQLEILVVPLDRHSFAKCRLRKPISFTKASIVDTVRADHNDRQRGRYIRGYVQDRLFPYSDVPGLISDRRNGNRPVFRDGFLPFSDGSIRDPEEFTQLAMKRTRQLFRDEMWRDSRLVSHLKAILETAAKHDLKVVLVQCPVTREFDDALRKQVPDAEFDDLVQSILAEYPETSLLNVRDRFLDRHDLFNDVNHLNPSGAREFSKLLRDELQQLGYLAP